MAEENKKIIPKKDKNVKFFRVSESIHTMAKKVYFKEVHPSIREYVEYLVANDVKDNHPEIYDAVKGENK